MHKDFLNLKIYDKKVDFDKISSAISDFFKNIEF